MKLTPFIRILLVMCFSIASISSFAQPDPDDPGEDPDAPVPVDGGIGIVVAAAALYKVKKIRDEKDSSEQ